MPYWLLVEITFSIYSQLISFFLPLIKAYFTYFEESHCSLGNLSVQVFLLRWWLYFAHNLIYCVSNIYVKKRKRKRKKKSLLLDARSFKYIDLSKNIKETRVHAISKDGPLLPCFFLHKSPPMQSIKNILVCSFRYHVCLFQMNKQLTGNVAISEIQNCCWANILTNRLCLGSHCGCREPLQKKLIFLESLEV